MQHLLLIAACMAWSATAAITLFDLQPIADFSDSCTQAYGTQILNCDNTQFAPFDQYATCSIQCLNELNTLARTLQKACQSDGVKPDTVIAHAFQGDLANWLCERGTYTTQTPTVVSGTATNAKATSSNAAATSTSSAATSSTTESSSISSSTSGSSNSSAIASSSSSSTTFSTTTVATTTMAATSSTSTTSSRPRQTATIGDSTPFDQTVYANYAKPTEMDKETLRLIRILVPIAISLVSVGFGGWAY